MQTGQDVLLTQSIFTSLAHRYWNESWSAAENAEIYGTEASVEGLGSNLRLDLSARGAPADLREDALRATLARIKSRVDHQSLFYPHASSLEQITEDLATEIFARPCEGGRWHSLTVWQSAKLGVTARPNATIFELHAKVQNLTLTVEGERLSPSGLVVDRQSLLQAVTRQNAEFAALGPMPAEEWGAHLFARLKIEIKNLKSVKIDLGSHEYLQVQSDS